MWGGEGSDFFELKGKSSNAIDWVRDFDARKKPIDGGDKINLFFGSAKFNWDESTTEIRKKYENLKMFFEKIEIGGGL